MTHWPRRRYMRRRLSNSSYQQMRRCRLSKTLTRDEGEDEQMYSEEVKVTLHFLPRLSGFCDRWHPGLSKSLLNMESGSLHLKWMVAFKHRSNAQAARVCHLISASTFQVPDFWESFRGSFGTGNGSRSGLSKADSNRGKMGVVAQKRWLLASIGGS